MLFELTTGKRLFKGASEYETLKLICEREYPKPSQVRPGYPPALEKIVVKALAKATSDRYQSAREMQADLETFVRDERIHVSTINLTQFMQGLFEDKLVSQKEQLLQGKQLADIIEANNPLESMADLPHTGVTSSAAAAHTLSGDVKKKGNGLVIGLLAIIVMLGGGVGGTWWWMKKKQAQQLTAGPVVPPVVIAKGSIEVKSDPPGAAIWVDGDLRPEPTPATILQLPTSGKPIEIKVTKDGFEAFKQTITLTEKDSKATVSTTMTKGSVVIDVTVLPAAAKPTVMLDAKKYDVLTVDGISSGDQHKLTVSANGYLDFTTNFIAQAQEKKHFDVTLQPFVPGKPNGTGAAKPSGTGKLNVGASGGWCNISVDGAAKGPTPLAGIELSAGPHRVTCTPEGKAAQSQTVDVPKDGTGRCKFTL
jgi:serine/threonine-protein kinase